MALCERRQCLTGLNGCSANAECIDYVVAAGDGVSCLDINECSMLN